MSKDGKDYGTRMYESILKTNISDEMRNSYIKNRDKIIREYNTINLSIKERGNIKVANYGNRLNFSIYNGSEFLPEKKEEKHD